VFVQDPDEDVSSVYSIDYYEGRGADSLVNYEHEWKHLERTVRQFEWRGVARILSRYLAMTPGRRVLDFGCGNGAFVHWLRRNYGLSAAGFDIGVGAELAKTRGVPILDPADLAAENQFDAVTAIEALEHVTDPLAVLETIRRVLKPGGVLFYTTGNASKFRNELVQWDYVQPEFHVSFYEPATMEHALRSSGLIPIKVGFGEGHVDIITYKMLKRLRVKITNPLMSFVPWIVLARAADLRFGVSAFPIGQKPCF
jgi:cyclopropane fatty-acyl-phospholipid synthase-like methyltransferase